ncbi:hypothetical protein BVC80_9101g102 [Macleaya cordata]|uniref:Uncharacterized protein n=1 Tax=Macleaya cordata TaxID=56857 RepID=A0A200QGQ8_MACCD|nr:hypothetical protein BVC80_9101g102 [Macleaya cordata]
MQRTQHDDNSVDELHQQFNNLEQDWDSYKRSKSRYRLNRCDSDDEKSTTVEILHQLSDYSSPRRLMITSLQQRKQSQFLEDEEEDEEEWKVRTNDLAVLEILRERRAAIESGKLKGKRLLEALESAASSREKMNGNNNNNKEEDNQNIYSGCSNSSSVLIQGSEVRSLCSSSYSSSYSDDDINGFDGGYCYSSCSSVEKMGTDKVAVSGDDYQVAEEKRDHVDGVGVGVDGWSDGEKWMVVMGWVSIFLLAFALGIITWKGFNDGYGDESGMRINVRSKNGIAWGAIPSSLKTPYDGELPIEITVLIKNLPFVHPLTKFRFSFQNCLCIEIFLRGFQDSRKRRGRVLKSSLAIEVLI